MLKNQNGVVQLSISEEGRYREDFLQDVKKFIEKKGIFLFKKSKTRGRPPTKLNHLKMLSVLENIYIKHDESCKLFYTKKYERISRKPDDNFMDFINSELDKAFEPCSSEKKQKKESSTRKRKKNGSGKLPKKICDSRTRQDVLYTINLSSLLQIASENETFEKFKESVEDHFSNNCETMDVTRDVMKNFSEKEKEKEKIPLIVSQCYPDFWSCVDKDLLENFENNGEKGSSCAIRWLEHQLENDPFFACFHNSFGLERITADEANSFYIERQLNAHLKPVLESTSYFHEKKRIGDMVFNKIEKSIGNDTLGSKRKSFEEECHFDTDWKDDNNKRVKMTFDEQISLPKEEEQQEEELVSSQDENYKNKIISLGLSTNIVRKDSLLDIQTIVNKKESEEREKIFREQLAKKSKELEKQKNFLREKEKKRFQRKVLEQSKIIRHHIDLNIKSESVDGNVEKPPSPVPDLHKLLEYLEDYEKDDIWSSESEKIQVDPQLLISNYTVYNCLREIGMGMNENSDFYNEYLAAVSYQKLLRLYEQENVQTFLVQHADEDQDNSDLLFFSNYDQKSNVVRITPAVFECLIENQYLFCFPVQKVYSGLDKQSHDVHSNEKTVRYFIGNPFSSLPENVLCETCDTFIGVQIRQYKVHKKNVAGILSQRKDVPVENIDDYTKALSRCKIYGSLLSWYRKFSCEWFTYCENIIGQKIPKKEKEVFSKMLDGILKQDSKIEHFCDSTTKPVLFINDPLLDINIAEYVLLFKYWEERKDVFIVKPCCSWQEWRQQQFDIEQQISYFRQSHGQVYKKLRVVLFRYPQMRLDWVSWSLQRISETPCLQIVCMGILYERLDMGIHQSEIPPFIVREFSHSNDDSEDDDNPNKMSLDTEKFQVFHVEPKSRSCLSLCLEPKESLSKREGNEEENQVPKVLHFVLSIYNKYTQACEDDPDIENTAGVSLYGFPVQPWFFEPLVGTDSDVLYSDSPPSKNVITKSLIQKKDYGRIIIDENDSISFNPPLLSKNRKSYMNVDRFEFVSLPIDLRHSLLSNSYPDISLVENFSKDQKQVTFTDFTKCLAKVLQGKFEKYCTRKEFYGYENMKLFSDGNYCTTSISKCFNHVIVSMGNNICDIGTSAGSLDASSVMNVWAEENCVCKRYPVLSKDVIYEPGMKVLVGQSQRILIIESISFVTTQKRSDMYSTSRQLLTGPYTTYTTSSAKTDEDFFSSERKPVQDSMEKILERVSPVSFSTWSTSFYQEQKKGCTVYDDSEPPVIEPHEHFPDKKYYSSSVMFLNAKQLDDFANEYHKQVHMKKWSNRVGYIMTGIDQDGNRHVVRLCNGSSDLTIFEVIPIRDFLRFTSSGLLRKPTNALIIPPSVERTDVFDYSLFHACILQCQKNIYVINC